jgi:hypothetical protein
MLKEWMLNIIALALLLVLVLGGSHLADTRFTSHMERDTQLLAAQLKEAGMSSDQIRALTEALSKVASNVSFLALKIFYVIWFGLFSLYLLLSQRRTTGGRTTEIPSSTGPRSATTPTRT